MIPALLSFIIVIAIIITFSKQELSIVLSVGALLLSILTGVNIIESLINTFTNPSIILLAIAMGLIPILGGIMNDSGLIMELVQKMNVSKKSSLMLSPAVFGLLPIAGGALLSAPIVEQIDTSLDSNKKVAINVWYRHVLILIYPLSSALIIGSVLSGIYLYHIVVAMIIPCLVMIIIGYITLFRTINFEREEHERNIKRVIHNIIPIILAPMIDFIGRTFLDFLVPEVFLLIGLCISIMIALKFSHFSLSQVKDISKKMKIWRFPLLIFAMFWFLEVFMRSGVPEAMSALSLSFFVLMCLGFFLGFTTGRIQVPLSILIPIFLFQYALTVMSLFNFTFLYCAIFLGYLITPIHPCVAYSINYFEANYRETVKSLAVPAFLCFGILIIVYAFLTILLLIH